MKEACSMPPSTARKLVEEAVAYAATIGFQPHPDYRKARLIFGDIDASQCDEQFTFGKDGKPYFIGGPYDDMARCRQVINTLQRTCGEGNFHYLIPITADTDILPAPGYIIPDEASAEAQLEAPQDGRPQPKSPANY
jgi:hypothetical protein